MKLSGVDRHDCLSPSFSVMCELWVELVLFKIAQHSVHPPKSGPSSRYLPSYLHCCYMFCNVRVFSSHGHTTKGVSGWHMWWLAWPLHRSWTFHFWFVDYQGWSFLVLPWIHLNIFISVVCILCCSVLCSAQHSLPYIIVGLMTVLYSLFFSFTWTFVSQITPDNPSPRFPRWSYSVIDICSTSSGCFYCWSQVLEWVGAWYWYSC